jgi:hypothetical protein
MTSPYVRSHMEETLKFCKLSYSQSLLFQFSSFQLRTTAFRPPAPVTTCNHPAKQRITSSISCLSATRYQTCLLAMLSNRVKWLLCHVTDCYDWLCDVNEGEMMDVMTFSTTKPNWYTRTHDKYTIDTRLLAIDTFTLSNRHYHYMIRTQDNRHLLHTRRILARYCMCRHPYTRTSTTHTQFTTRNWQYCQLTLLTIRHYEHCQSPIAPTTANSDA